MSRGYVLLPYMGYIGINFDDFGLKWGISFHSIELRLESFVFSISFTWNCFRQICSPSQMFRMEAIYDISCGYIL